MLTFLHLSDLHFTTADADTPFDHDLKIRQALLADLGKDGRTRFDAILVTGDLAYHGRADEFERAGAWLEKVRTATSSAPEAIYVVPGNHDVNHEVVSKGSSLWDLHQLLRTKMSLEERSSSLDLKLKDQSLDFLRALGEYRAFATLHECPTNPKAPAWYDVLGEGRKLEDGTQVRFHGLNSALLSDCEDAKANLLLGACQFHHFDDRPEYVNVVLCHHSPAWLLDGNESNDFFRNQAHVVLCGHDHDPRCYLEGNSLRVFAGAVHPSRRESRWEPCYHVLRLSISTTPKRLLGASVETRVWRDKDKCFGPYVQSDGSLRHEEPIPLPAWAPSIAVPPIPHSPTGKCTLSSAAVTTEATTVTKDEFTAARRKLIVHFFRLGTLPRYQAVSDAGVWDESDDAFDGQARWARVFERAEKNDRFAALWDAVAASDETLTGQPNPFKRT